MNHQTMIIKFDFRTDSMNKNYAFVSNTIVVNYCNEVIGNFSTAIKKISINFSLIYHAKPSVTQSNTHANKPKISFNKYLLLFRQHV
jgi:hypothetical protein